MPNEKKIERVAVVGTGVVGASWAALFLARGLQVFATDPLPQGETTLHNVLDRVWPDLVEAGLASGASRQNLTFSSDLAKTLARAQWVQENGPERVDLKKQLFVQMDRLAPIDVILATSSSGLSISELQSGCTHPERCLTGHPFNPAHIIPAVEVIGGKLTSPEAVRTALRFYSEMGKKPIHVLKEVKGHVANRLQAALWRECVSLISSNVISVKDIDELVCWGLGPRWAVMGPNLLFHLGGGIGGMPHFLEHLGPPMSSWWNDLGKPELTPKVTETLIAGVNEEASGRSILQLEEQRDRLLCALFSLKRQKEDSPGHDV